MVAQALLAAYPLRGQLHVIRRRRHPLTLATVYNIETPCYSKLDPKMAPMQRIDHGAVDDATN
jgi:hypothetical protein